VAAGPVKPGSQGILSVLKVRENEKIRKVREKQTKN